MNLNAGRMENRKLKTEMDTETDGGNGIGRRKWKYPSNYHIVMCLNQLLVPLPHVLTLMCLI